MFGLGERAASALECEKLNTKLHSSFKKNNQNRKTMEELLSKTNFVCKLITGLKINCKPISGLFN